MIKKIRLTILLLVAGLSFFGWYPNVYSQGSVSANGQGDYIILNDGTKLNGKLLSNYDFADYDEIEFSSSKGIRKYGPLDIQSFGLENGRLFESLLLPDEEEKLFAQVLFTGQFQLLSQRSRFYIKSDAGGIDRLKIIERDSQPGIHEKKVNLYISQLKIIMAGRCGIILGPKIETSRLDEQDLLKLMIDYHKCEDLPYVLHIQNIPLLKISPTAGLGLGYTGLKSISNQQGRGGEFVTPFNFSVFGGLRFHDFRNTPRISLDLRAGVNMMATTWNSSVSNGTFFVTSSEKITQTTFSIPLSLNYSLWKKEDREIYFGLMAGVWISQLKSDGGIVDLTVIQNEETSLRQLSTIRIIESIFVPGMKVGSNFKGNWFGEFQAQRGKQLYSSELPNFNDVSYDAWNFSFLVGYKF